ncbi:hypothetical protein H7F33_09175 [Pedobacter sp. PAMC26386]|nr:hypothetical protein H7F33_09175 [Pedobacter sp. PAMC26386]
MRRITRLAIVITLTGLLDQAKAQDLKPGRLNSFRLSESFVRGNSNLSRITVLGYRYQLSPEVRIGADLGYQGRTYIDRVNEFTAAASTDFIYSHGRTVELYGTVGAGYRIMTGGIGYSGRSISEEFNGANKFIYQINPIGIRVGNGAISGFAELGWGYRGLMTIGVAYKF